jgi:acyl-coenzyme A synthetase/AMP-(fatty) acid ligase
MDHRKSETLMLVSNPYFGVASDRVAGTVGTPLPGVDVRVVNDDGSPFKVGVARDDSRVLPTQLQDDWTHISPTRK